MFILQAPTCLSHAQVRYNVSNWLEKNKDPLNDTVAATLKASLDCDLIKTIWASYQTQEEAAAEAKGWIVESIRDKMYTKNQSRVKNRESRGGISTDLRKTYAYPCPYQAQSCTNLYIYFLNVNAEKKFKDGNGPMRSTVL